MTMYRLQDVYVFTAYCGHGGRRARECKRTIASAYLDASG